MHDPNYRATRLNVILINQSHKIKLLKFHSRPLFVDLPQNFYEKKTLDQRLTHDIKYRYTRPEFANYSICTPVKQLNTYFFI